jgi:pimeloyl-ACP methyl ester carboxylesterase
MSDAAGSASPRSASFETRDGGTVHATLSGTGTHAVLLVHGGRFTKESWDDQVPAFVEAGLLVLAIDLRGRGQSRGGSAGDDGVHHDVLAAVRGLRDGGATRISVVGASYGGWAAASAAVEAPREIDRLVLMAAPGIDRPEDLTGRTLFITTRDDTSGRSPRLPGIREQYARAPEPKQLVVLDGSAHAQFVFETEQGDAMLAAILEFLSAP